MTEVSAKLVMELRDATNLPMMKCKQALAATNGDKQAAIEWLRKQGIAATGKFEGRETPNGAIALALAPGRGVLVKVGCQTDFVAGNEVFKAFVKDLAEQALASGAESAEALKAQAYKGQPMAEAIAGMIQKIGENIVLTKVAVLTGAEVTGYNHGGRIATLIAGTGPVDKLRQVALHTASASPAPIALDRAAVDPALVKKEEEILAATPEVQAKPEAMRPKIVQGKLGRFFKENCLLEQEMLLDAEKGESVEKYAKRQGITVTGFVRVNV
jgi:elongation factor Ts